MAGVLATEQDFCGVTGSGCPTETSSIPMSGTMALAGFLRLAVEVEGRELKKRGGSGGDYDVDVSVVEMQRVQFDASTT